ncbi:Methionyl-tRNA synthetase [Spraguea lophii 42_110]|uniref:methionine--tRNA ligase n=1 Tax=Spraguea lophii (strain 42_110) TaxID=1358809 RepID=S7W8N6_SPRLO|nr:Methionyl-tRNA synthetase [Spraguea lophii 42_110]
MESEKRIITSALPYSNNLPHLGNIIGCVLSSDVFARYCKKKGYNTIHICGTDEYGTAIEVSAMEQKMHPRDLCNRNSKLHKEIYDWFDIKFDEFGRTSCKEHIEMVQKIFYEVYNNGHFEKKESQQFFCENCNFFLADRFVNGICSKCEKESTGDQCDYCGTVHKVTDILEPKCTICSSEPSIKNTVHLYLKLEGFKDQLKNILENKKMKWSKNAIEITKDWLGLELHSRAMTRDLKYKWGVPVPIEGFEDKVFYVWFDAPIGYFTFIKKLVKDEFDIWMKDSTLYQFMGKDNVAFHSIIFPSVLLATGKDYKIVDVISCTEHLQFKNMKFSKSKKIGVFGSDLIDNTLGNASMWRYYLLKIRPEGKDTNFAIDDFKAVYSADLQKTLANLVNRVLKFLNKQLLNDDQNKGYLEYENVNEKDVEFIDKVNSLYQQHLDELEEIKIKCSLTTVITICHAANQKLQQSIQDNNKERRIEVFKLMYSVIVLLGNILEPFIPATAADIKKMTGHNTFAYPEKMEIIKKITINEIIPLFPPLSEELSKTLEKYN